MAIAKKKPAWGLAFIAEVWYYRMVLLTERIEDYCKREIPEQTFGSQEILI